MKYLKKYSVFESNFSNEIEHIKEISSKLKGFIVNIRDTSYINILIYKPNEETFYFKDISSTILEILSYTDSLGFKEDIDTIKGNLRIKCKIIDNVLYMSSGSQGRENYIDEYIYKIEYFMISLKNNI
jgi:hypothetical protein